MDGHVEPVLGADPQDLVLHEGLELLDDDDRLLSLDEVGDLLLGQGVGESELEDGDSGHELLYVAVGDSGGDDSDLSLSLDPVEGGFLGELKCQLVLLEEPDAVLNGVGGDVDELGVILVKVSLEGGVPVDHSEDDGGAGVVDAGGGPVEDGQSGLLGNPVGLLHEVLGLLRVGRLDHRDESQCGVVTVILFVLGTVGGGIVRAHDQHPRPDASVGEGHEGVSGDVEPHVLHEYEGTHAGGCGGGRHLHGGLLVGGEFEIQPRLVGDRL